MLSWRGAQLKKRDNFTFTFTNKILLFSIQMKIFTVKDDDFCDCSKFPGVGNAQTI
jgi:hypothetical protein